MLVGVYFVQNWKPLQTYGVLFESVAIGDKLVCGIRCIPSVCEIDSVKIICEFEVGCDKRCRDWPRLRC